VHTHKHTHTNNTRTYVGTRRLTVRTQRPLATGRDDGERENATAGRCAATVCCRRRRRRRRLIIVVVIVVVVVGGGGVVGGARCRQCASVVNNLNTQRVNHARRVERDRVTDLTVRECERALCFRQSLLFVHFFRVVPVCAHTQVSDLSQHCTNTNKLRTWPTRRAARRIGASNCDAACPACTSSLRARADHDKCAITHHRHTAVFRRVSVYHVRFRTRHRHRRCDRCFRRCGWQTLQLQGRATRRARVRRRRRR
jgi:hypothetical protein